MTASSDAMPAMSSHLTIKYRQKQPLLCHLQRSPTLRCSSNRRRRGTHKSPSTPERHAGPGTSTTAALSGLYPRPARDHWCYQDVECRHCWILGKMASIFVNTRPGQITSLCVAATRCLSLNKESDRPTLVKSRMSIQLDSPRGDRNVSRHPIATPCHWIRSSVPTGVQSWTLLQPSSDHSANKRNGSLVHSTCV